MESTAICERCSILTRNSYLFNCNHSLCSQCITRIIAFNHIKNIATQDQLQISCPCSLGTKIFPIADIPQLLTNSEVPSLCTMHGATAKFHCSKCEVWLCEGCIEIHKLLNSHHQLTQGHNLFKKCQIHEGQIRDHYCHACHETICPLCLLLQGAKHYSHKYQLIKDYANELRTQIPLCDVPTQMKRMEIFLGDFRRQVGNSLKKTLNKMDDLIQLIEESKLKYKSKIKQTLQRADILIDLLKCCYLDFNKTNDTLDIYLLRDLSTWNMELSQLELQPETEKQLKKFEEDLKEYFKIQPADSIHVDFKEYLKTPTVEVMHAVFQEYLKILSPPVHHDDCGILKENGKNTLTLTGHTCGVYSLIQLKDGRIASGSDDNTIIVWEEKEQAFQNTLILTGHKGYVRSLIEMEDGRIASGSRDSTIKIWEVKEKEFKNTLTLTGHTGYVSSLIQLKDGRIASGSEDITIKIWKVNENDFQNILTLLEHKDAVSSLIQLKDGRIASGSWDNTIIVWEEKGSNFISKLTLIEHYGPVFSIIQLKDGRVASGSGDTTIKVWIVNETGYRNTLTLSGHGRWVLSLIQLTDGRIASGSYDKTIKIWEVKEKEHKNTLTLTGHNDWVRSVIQLKDGRIASGSDDKTIKIWE